MVLAVLSDGSLLLVLSVCNVEPSDGVVFLDVPDGSDGHHEVDDGHELTGLDLGVVGGAHVHEGSAVGCGGEERHHGLLDSTKHD